MNQIRANAADLRLATAIPDAVAPRLEPLFLAFLKEFRLRHPAPAAETLVGAVERISAIYNRRLDESSFARRALLDARRHFFMPTDLPKVWIPLAEHLVVNPGLLQKPRISVLDLGAGAGACASGLLLYLGACGYKGTVQLRLDEPDPELAQSLADAVASAALVAGLKTERLCTSQSLEDLPSSPNPDRKGGGSALALPNPDRKGGGSSRDRFDVVLCQNVVNEVFAPETFVDQGLDLVDRVTRLLTVDGAFILVEPALMMPSRRVSQLRDRLLTSDYNVQAPCVCQGPCPETTTRAGYCFHTIRVPSDPYLQRLGDLSALRRHEVNFCYLTIGRGQVTYADRARELCAGGPDTSRLISHPQKRSGGYMFFACHATGLVRLWLPRHLDRDDGLVRVKRLGLGSLVFLDQGPRPGADDDDANESSPQD
jgi:SAM-dependent methyltransferase